eukprot:Lithocolla_globosa_v1_NODE_4761_length_1370_cov_11.803341.p2 type:complete len:107 gc:universal NODE_4761_length_1370_cov_11.803341:874-1194(+)
MYILASPKSSFRLSLTRFEKEKRTIEKKLNRHWAELKIRKKLIGCQTANEQARPKRQPINSEQKRSLVSESSIRVVMGLVSGIFFKKLNNLIEEFTYQIWMCFRTW